MAVNFPFLTLALGVCFVLQYSAANKVHGITYSPNVTYFFNLCKTSNEAQLAFVMLGFILDVLINLCRWAFGKKEDLSRFDVFMCFASLVIASYLFYPWVVYFAQ